MTTVHTAYGDGEIVNSTITRGRKQFKVAGYGFEVWLNESEILSKIGSSPDDRHHCSDPSNCEWDRHNEPEANLDHGRYTTESPGYHEAAAFDHEPSQHVNEDNSTTLPYDYTPQFPVDMFRQEQTQSPDHEIDLDERTHSSDSRTGEPREDEHPYPGPNPDLFAKSGGYESEDDFFHGPGSRGPEDQCSSGTVDVPGMHPTHPDHPDHLPGAGHLGGYERPAGLSDKYAYIVEAADHYNDPIQRFRDDAHGAIQRHGGLDISAGLDRETGEWMDLVLADKSIHTAAWKDVRGKATRLVREGAVHVEAMDSDAIYAKVDGDNGNYEVMILNGSAYPNGGFNGGKRAIANWKCSCEWGKWAFKRKFTFVGRLCSHAYASYLVQQSDHQKRNPQHFKPKKKRTSAILEDFKSWIKDENGDHVDVDAADNFLSTQDKIVSREDAEKVYDYVLTTHSERPERDYDQDGYSNDPDDAYKTAADVLQHQPGKLTPHLYVVPEGEEPHFEDLGDDRKTTGPDQIQARRTAKGSDKVTEHHPAFAWHNESKDDFPDEGIVHFSSLHLTADEDLLNKLRDLGNEQPSEHFHDCKAHNEEVSHVVDELHDRGYAASPLVAMKSAAMWKTAWPSGTVGQDVDADGQPLNPTGGDVLGIPRSVAGPGPGGSEGHTPAPNPTGGSVLGVPRSVAGPGPGGSDGHTPSSTTLTQNVSPAGPAATPAAPAGGGPQGPHAPGSSVPSPSTFGDGPGGTYTVKPGDNLTDIAQSHGTSVDALQKANPNTISGPSGTTNVNQNADLIHPSDNLKLPGGNYQPGSAGHGNVLGPPSPSSAGGSGGNAMDIYNGYKNTGPAASGGLNPTGGGAAGIAKGLSSPTVSPANGIHAKKFAELYFQAADDESSDGGDDKKQKSVGPAAGAPAAAPSLHAPGTPGGQGGPYTPVQTPGAQVNAPRPPAGTNAFGQSLPNSPVGGGHDGNSSPMAPTDIHGGGSVASNPAGAPAAGTVSVSGPTGTDSGAPGQKKPQDGSAAGGGAGGLGGGLGGGMGGQLAEGLMGALPGALGALTPALSSGIGGLASGLGGALGSGLSGLTKLLSHDPQRFAAVYMQADGNFLGDGGPDWMDHSFAGSGPDRQDWSSTSESYVDEHERPKHQETWVTDGDGDVVKYTKDRPKQAARFAQQYFQADMLSGDAGFGGGAEMAHGGGTVSPAGSGMGSGGAVESAATGAGAPTMGGLGGGVGGGLTAAMSTSSRDFWADAFHPDEQGYFNPHQKYDQAYDKGDTGFGQEFDQQQQHDPHQQQQGGDQGGGSPLDMLEGGGGGSAAAGLPEELAEAAPMVLAAAYDGSDVVRQFHASGGGCIGASASSGGQYGDDQIAKNAQRMLRTAGRHYSPAEERELEEESHVLGARNLNGLDLTGTHYVD